MKAAVLTGFGAPDVVRIAERPTPKINPDQVLVKLHASTVNSGDARIRSKNVPKGFGFIMSLVFGFNTPRKEVLGTVFAGEVTEVGANATGFKVGDLVYGSTEMKMGAHAEFVAIKADAAIVPLPNGLDATEAASLVFGGTTALYFIDKSGLGSGQRILVNAAAGSVGLAITQIASAMGAHVTAVASTRNHDFLREMGADEVIDYKSTDLRKLNQKFDVVADCLGTLPFAQHRHLLVKGGRFAQITGTLCEMLTALLQSATSTYKIVGGTALATKSSLENLSKLAEAGALKSVIDKTFAFDDIQQAYAHVDTGHKRGNVVLTY